MVNFVRGSTVGFEKIKKNEKKFAFLKKMYYLRIKLKFIGKSTYFIKITH